MPNLSREDLAFAYLDTLPFEPYPFQEEAILGWFSSEQGLLVTAPTGMGKTAIAEGGIFETMKTGQKAYYTSPLIALCEQKYREIQVSLERWGFNKHYVGLVTGNRRENPDAPILVVVAEILFNRLLSHHNSKAMGEPSHLFDDVSTVVMDEFHYFADEDRGMVWEFTLGLLPEHLRTLLISATVGNAYEFVSWMRNNLNRKLKLVEGRERKVPLTYRWVGDQLLNEQLELMVRGDEENRLTPALVFCFDRNECWEVADQIRGRDIVSPDQQKQIAALIEQRNWNEGAGTKIKQLLLRGVGIHHAGVLPKYRRIVEDLFQQKLLSYCICTETLAAGINLPARSVVLPTIMKGPWGEKKIMESSTAHQIFGRAGRPQYDSQGFVFALAPDDDVKIARWKEKYDQISDDEKDPKLLAMKKKMKKKMPKRRETEQYWTEEQFKRLKDLPPGSLTSRGHLPWRLLAHIISVDHDIEPIRKIVGRRLMGAKRLQEGQKKLDEMLLTLWDGGYVKLDPEPVICNDGEFPPCPSEEPPRSFAARNTPPPREGNNSPPSEGCPTGRGGSFRFAYPTETLRDILYFRGVNPIFALFLLQYIGRADHAERLQAFESILELPGSLGPFVRVPKEDMLPNGPLSLELDPILLTRGLATIDELVLKTEEEQEEERERRRHFGNWLDGPVFQIRIAEKLKRLFQFEHPTVDVRITPVWSAGEILLDFNGDFNKYIVSKSLQKQEGIIFRHLLRLILLLEEFLEKRPSDCSENEWRAEMEWNIDTLTKCCREVDPESTEEMLQRPPDALSEPKS